MRRLPLLLAAWIAACAAPPSPRATSLTSAEIAHAPWSVGTRHEITFDAPSLRPVTATFTAPSGRITRTGAFTAEEHLRVRYTPREPGLHRWSIRDADHEIGGGVFDAGPRRTRGFVGVDPTNPRRLVRDDGTTVFVVGAQAADARDVQRIAAYGMTAVRVAAPDPADGRGGDALDALFAAAESFDVDVVLIAFAGKDRRFFAEPGARAQAIARLRYISDRWGSSPRLLAVDLLDEPERRGIDERLWIPWAEAMSLAWRAVDPYAHLVTAGPVGLHWNVTTDERPWYESPTNDLVQWHLGDVGLGGPQGVADAILAKLRETGSLRKPVLCGAWRAADDDRTHVAIWTLAMAGAGALSAGQLDPARARHLGTLARFLRSLDERRPYAPREDVRVLTPSGARVWSLATEDEADRVVWMLGAPESYGMLVTAEIGVSVPRGGRYRVRWADDVTGEHAVDQPRELTAGDDDLLVLPSPPFRRHIVARVTRIL